MYVGVVCDASLSPGSCRQGYSATAVDLLAAKSNLRAKVFALDIASGNFDPAPIFDFPLAYPKGAPVGTTDNPREYGFWPWTDRVPQLAFMHASQVYGPTYGDADFYMWPSRSSMTLNSMWMARW